MQRVRVGSVLLLLVVATACTAVRPWERETLARPEMAWDPDELDAAFRKHIFFSKEAGLVGGSGGGGGCGCN